MNGRDMCRKPNKNKQLHTDLYQAMIGTTIVPSGHQLQVEHDSIFAHCAEQEISSEVFPPRADVPAQERGSCGEGDRDILHWTAAVCWSFPSMIPDNIMYTVWLQMTLGTYVTDQSPNLSNTHTHTHTHTRTHTHMHTHKQLNPPTP